ncbi:hypothetical protein M2302_002920 [Micromonospora sp. A200]|uniref:hypothetical protein n=1 Tax=Micromonospora sp. A200 TaxID=2940568 RepID=UPI002473C7CD|nr:hypothetical protein [Micromonospora sp. A200]MDH6462739.1 hypothetical protein [Micromonospora sp. A200]
MIQITRQAGALSGTLDQSSLNNADPTTTKSTHAAFTGTMDGEAMTLSFPQGLGFVTNLSGTVSGSKMTLQVPQEDGSIAPFALAPGSTDTYNRKVAVVQAKADANLSAREAAAASSAAAASLQERRQQVAKAAESVMQDAAAVRAGLANPPSFSDFERDLAAAKENLANAKTNAAKADREQDESSACSDAYSAESDAYSVESDSYSIDSDMSGLASEIQALKDAAAQLDRNLSEYQQAAAALPGYTPPNAPDANRIQDLSNQVSTKTAAWKKKGAGYQTEVAKLLKEARAVAAQAQKDHC